MFSDGRVDVKHVKYIKDVEYVKDSGINIVRVPLDIFILKRCGEYVLHKNRFIQVQHGYIYLLPELLSLKFL